ncbi:MAG: Gfo/Idh/MocA family oxidoreductase [Bacteroidetes bacterium]|nr:Gfo/Idh/MocA family oxidoreductase [Bacteroidota bacterium]
MTKPLNPSLKFFLPLVLTFVLFFFVSIASAQLLRVAVVGLNHDHVHGILNDYKQGRVIIVGISEADQDLVQRYKKRDNLPDSIFYKDLPSLLAHVKPDAVLAFNPIAEHIKVVEVCAPKGISVMVEKPLATTVADAEKMAAMARKGKIQLLTNYETTWYPSNQEIYDLIYSQNIMGDIRKMVVHSGHQGPREIGCSEDFLKWLTDPVLDGGGAVMDFGCYGANLMTWLMKGKAPISVTAITKQIKPNIYPKVDDYATIMVEYPNATGVIEASWNWPYGIKDLEVFGVKSYLHALNGNVLEERNTDTAVFFKIPVKPLIYKDNLAYLAAVLRGEYHSVDDLSSLENNLTVVRILEAAKQSAKEGRKIMLAKN